MKKNELINVEQAMMCHEWDGSSLHREVEGCVSPFMQRRCELFWELAETVYGAEDGFFVTDKTPDTECKAENAAFVLGWEWPDLKSTEWGRRALNPGTDMNGTPNKYFHTTLYNACGTDFRSAYAMELADPNSLVLNFEV